MATHNMAMMTGYLLSDPTIQNMGGEEKAFLYIRTMRRDVENVGRKKFEDIMVYYDGSEMMGTVRKLKRFDLIFIKGVLDIVINNKVHKCPNCGAIGYRENGTFPFIYPQYLRRLDNVANSFEYDNELPDAILANHYNEISNFMILLGSLVNQPELIKKGRQTICRYQIAINRKYYIPSQPDTTSDYPWVYSFGEQAEKDMRHLEEGSIVILDGYYHAREVTVPVSCAQCQTEYVYRDMAIDIIPYSVEYLIYKTDEDIENARSLFQ